jgi:tetratricopeptide (TPR) repeat protein
VWRSLLVALLFAIHPLNVESVAWVAERKSLLSALFSMAALNAYVAYARGLQRKHYLLTIGFFALALMSKSMAVSLPLILMLMDYWPLARLEGPWPFCNGRRLLLEKLPLIAMSAAISALSVVAMRAQNILVKAAAEPLSVRLENAAVSYATYLGKLFVPVNLSVFYPHPEHALPAGAIAASVVLLVGLSSVAFFLRGARYLAVGWLWFLISLLPVIGLVQVGNQAMADRYAYLPFVGIYIILAWGLAEITERVALPRWIPTLVSAALVLGLAIAASGYLRYWQDGVQLFTNARLSVGRPDTTIDEGMGDSLVAAGRYNEAYGYYNEACTLAPKDYSCHYNMAEILYHDHRLTEALDEYRMAGTLTDRRSMALECLINSSEILITLGDYQTAAIQLDGALQIDPGNVAAMRLRSQAESLIKTAQGAPALPASSF